MFNLNTENIKTGTSYPNELVQIIVGDSTNQKQVVSKRLSKTTEYPILLLRNNSIANILGRWCDINNGEFTLLSNIDLFTYQKFIKPIECTTEDKMREFFRDLILFSLYSNYSMQLHYNYTAQECQDLKTFLILNAANNDYFNDQLSFAEFEYATFYNSIKVFKANSIVPDKNHFTYEYIVEGDTRPKYVLGIKGNGILISSSWGCYVYEMPKDIVDDITYINKIDTDFIYSIVMSMFNKLAHVENASGYTQELIDMLELNKQLVLEGIAGYYKRLYKAAHLYIHKEKESDIYPIK